MSLNPRFVRTWKRALPFIDDALAFSGGSHTAADVMRQVRAGKCQLWLGERSAAVTEWFDQPRKRSLSIWLAGGDLAEMKVCQPGMEAFARAGGGDSLTYFGRPTPFMLRNGWSRGTGFRLEFLAMTKDLWE